MQMLIGKLEKNSLPNYRFFIFFYDKVIKELLPRGFCDLKTPTHPSISNSSLKQTDQIARCTGSAKDTNKSVIISSR